MWEVRLILIPIILAAFYGFTLSGYFSLGKLLAVALCGLWLSLGGIKERDDRIPLAYLAWLTWATVFSRDPWTSLVHLHGTFQAGLLCAMLCVPFWACVGPEDRSELEIGLRIAAALVSAVGIVQLAGYFLPSPLPGGHRVYSLIGSPPYLGAFLALCFPFCEMRIERGLVLLCLLATGSRGAWIAVALGWLYMQDGISLRIKASGLVAISLLACAAFYLRPMSDLGRVAVWQAAWSGFKAHPWLGCGPGNFIQIAETFRTPLWDMVYGATTQDHAHNWFIEAACTCGVIGLALLCAWFWHIWRYADRKARAALLGVFVCGCLNPLSIVVKVLAIALAATCKPVLATESKTKRAAVRIMASNFFFLVMSLACCDRLITFYGQDAWSLSSVRAAVNLGLLRFVPESAHIKVVTENGKAH